MDFDDFIEKFRESLQGNKTMVFFAQCSIKYSGRAEAELGVGDRTILIKADNTLMIHQPTGGNPINYVKAGSKIEVEKKENHAIIKAFNSQHKDHIEVDVYRVYNFMHRKLEDGEKQILVGTEKDMSDMIYNNPELISKEFKPVSREEQTKYGFLDVFGHNKQKELVIVECKRYCAGLDAVTQLRRYVEKVKQAKGLQVVHGIIAAPSITENALKMAQDWGFKHVHVEPPKRLENYNKKQKALTEW